MSLDSNLTTALYKSLTYLLTYLLNIRHKGVDFTRRRYPSVCLFVCLSVAWNAYYWWRGGGLSRRHWLVSNETLVFFVFNCIFAFYWTNKMIMMMKLMSRKVIWTAIRRTSSRRWSSSRSRCTRRNSDERSANKTNCVSSSRLTNTTRSE